MKATQGRMPATAFWMGPEGIYDLAPLRGCAWGSATVDRAAQQPPGRWAAARTDAPGRQSTAEVSDDASQQR